MQVSASEPITKPSGAAEITKLRPETRFPEFKAESKASTRSIAVRLFLTVWLIYVVHFASNVVRETYLAITIAENFSVRVDEYQGLHPDLFQFRDGHSYINNNPGASLIAAAPYAVARPFITTLFRLKPWLAKPKPAAVYDDPRPLRNRFMNAARERGLDIKLALAAASMHAGLMAPIGAAAALCVFYFLRGRLNNEKKALWFALLYAFGTPIFFRSAFLNQNTLLAHYTLFAFVALAGARPPTPDDVLPAKRAAIAGFFIGLGILTDYSTAPLALIFGLWLLLQWKRAGGLRGVGAFMLGAAGPIALLLLYQWQVFGNPFLPAQAYMPPTDLSVRGWHGFFWPDPQLLKQNLFANDFGLFAFCPMLAAALFAPIVRKHKGSPTGQELILIFGAATALYLFNSSVQFAYLQYNTGVRYMVPAVPLLFMALVPVLLTLPRLAVIALLLPTVVISWSVAMARENVTLSLGHVFLRGFELPWLTVLEKTASGYAHFLADGVSPLPVFCLLAVVLWLVWRRPPAAA